MNWTSHRRYLLLLHPVEDLIQEVPQFLRRTGTQQPLQLTQLILHRFMIHLVASLNIRDKIGAIPASPGIAHRIHRFAIGFVTLGQRRYRATDADTCLPPHNPAHTLADLFHNDMKVLIHSLLRRRQQRYYTVTAEKAAIIMDVLRVYRIHCMHAGLRRAISAVRILQRDDKDSILQAAGIAFEKSAVLRCLQQLLLTLR